MLFDSLHSSSTLIFYPLDQFEILVLFFHWSGMTMPLGAAVITNLTVILFFNVLIFRFLLSIIFDRGSVHVWQFLLMEIYDLVKSIVRSNTSLRKHQYFSLFFFLFSYILKPTRVRWHRFHIYKKKFFKAMLDLEDQKEKNENLKNFYAEIVESPSLGFLDCDLLYNKEKIVRPYLLGFYFKKKYDGFFELYPGNQRFISCTLRKIWSLNESNLIILTHNFFHESITLFDQALSKLKEEFPDLNWKFIGNEIKVGLILTDNTCKKKITLVKSWNPYKSPEDDILKMLRELDSEYKNDGDPFSERNIIILTIINQRGCLSWESNFLERR